MVNPALFAEFLPDVSDDEIARAKAIIESACHAHGVERMVIEEEGWQDPEYPEDGLFVMLHVSLKSKMPTERYLALLHDISRQLEAAQLSEEDIQLKFLLGPEW